MEISRIDSEQLKNIVEFLVTGKDRITNDMYFSEITFKNQWSGVLRAEESKSGYSIQSVLG